MSTTKHTRDFRDTPIGEVFERVKRDLVLIQADIEARSFQNALDGMDYQINALTELRASMKAAFAHATGLWADRMNVPQGAPSRDGWCDDCGDSAFVLHEGLYHCASCGEVEAQDDPNPYSKEPLPEDADLVSAPDREETFREDVVHGEAVWGF